LLVSCYLVTVFIIQTKKENTNIKNTKNDNADNITPNERTQAPTSTNSNEGLISKLIDDKMKELATAFELKLGLAEKENQENKESKDAMQRHLDLLQQDKLRQDEENKQLKEKLARLEVQLEENTDNDFNYDSPDSDNGNDINYDTEIDNSTDYNSDINYDSECSDDEEDTNQNTKNDTRQNTRNNTSQNTNDHFSNEIYADPNYDSSDNEDRTNDICLD
jgi:hypothetical protein